MKLVILGSGTSVPHARRAAAGFWLETGGGSLLLDFSPDTPHRLAQEGLGWPELDAIWISHFHLDHLGGLAPFLFGLRWAPQVRERSKQLRIFGPAGINRVLHAFDQVNNYRLFEQRFPVEIIEVQEEGFEILAGLRAQTFSTPHTPESMCVSLVEADGRSLVYTADTGYSEEVAAFASDADLLLLECSFYRTTGTAKHLDLAQAMKMVELANPKRVVLTHLYSDWDGVDLVVEANKLWPGEVIEATDGLRLEV